MVYTIRIFTKSEQSPKPRGWVEHQATNLRSLRRFLTPPDAD